jgi:hypothetical protein
MISRSLTKGTRLVSSCFLEPLSNNLHIYNSGAARIRVLIRRLHLKKNAI